MRTRSINLWNKSPAQRHALKVEADFYQISSLLMLLSPRKFCTEEFGRVELTGSDCTATNKQAGQYSSVSSSTPFSPTELEKTVKILAGSRMRIGVAPRDILTNGKSWTNWGWYVFTGNGKLCGSDGKKDADYGMPIQPGSIVTVKLDKKFNINFFVDGEDWGVAYKNVATDFTSQSLYLCVSFDFDGDDPNVIVEGVVQLVA